MNDRIDPVMKSVRDFFDRLWYRDPAKAVFCRLKRDELRLVTAESLTGGMIAQAITAIPGSSDVFWGGMVSYSVEAKKRVLSIPGSVIEEYGVVSGETAAAMARGALSASGADVSVAVTGVAGPGGGSAAIPVGTVWMAVALRLTKDSTGVSDAAIRIETRRIIVRGTRNRVRCVTVREAFRLILDYLDRR